jgi:hypothetical protein
MHRVAAYRDPWAERIAALAWPLIIPICVVLWQRWLERMIPYWLEHRRGEVPSCRG